MRPETYERPVVGAESPHKAPYRDESRKPEFFTHLTHELRTPLSSILSLSQVMLARGPDADHERDIDSLKTIERNARYLLEMVTDVLDLSRIAAESMPVRPSAFRPGRVIRHAVDMARPLAEARSLRLALYLPTLPEICSDEGKFRQILHNLLSNAVKFTDHGSIVVAACAQEGSLTVTVSDSGVGISPRELERIFDQFMQVEDCQTHRRTGSGLGLAISRKLAALLGGELTVKSKPGLGSCFVLKLPLQDETAVPRCRS